MSNQELTKFKEIAFNTMMSEMNLAKELSVLGEGAIRDATNEWLRNKVEFNISLSKIIQELNKNKS